MAIFKSSWPKLAGILKRPGVDYSKAKAEDEADQAYAYKVEAKAETKLLTRTSTLLCQCQHQYYVSHDIMTVQTSLLHLRNTSSSSILSLILALFGRIISPL